VVIPTGHARKGRFDVGLGGGVAGRVGGPGGGGGEDGARDEAAERRQHARSVEQNRGGGGGGGIADGVGAAACMFATSPLPDPCFCYVAPRPAPPRAPPGSPPPAAPAPMAAPTPPPHATRVGRPSQPPTLPRRPTLPRDDDEATSGLRLGSRLRGAGMRWSK